MSVASSQPNSFSIRRHAVQQLLRQALDHAPETVHGLLGGHGQRVEAVLTLHGPATQRTLRDTLQAWQQQGLQLLAVYSSGEDAQDSLPAELLSEKLLSETPGATLSDLPRLIIRTDTKGRIEARLLVPAPDGSTRACALEMQEDGGLYPLEDRG